MAARDFIIHFGLRGVYTERDGRTEYIFAPFHILLTFGPSNRLTLECAGIASSVSFEPKGRGSERERGGEERERKRVKRSDG